MSKTMYRTCGKEIRAREVIKETEKTVTYQGHTRVISERKRSYSSNWFDTFTEAKTFLVKSQQETISALQKSIDRFRVDLQKIIELQPE